MKLARIFLAQIRGCRNIENMGEYGEILQYNKRDSRIYWPAYTTVSRVIKKIEREDEK